MAYAPEEEPLRAMSTISISTFLIATSTKG
jgi:hypothetical protein